MPMPRPRAVVFDFGGVLVDWNPRHLYRKLFSDPARMEWFLAEVCNNDWNIQQDAGRPFAEAIKDACARFPAEEALIRAFHERWDEMIAGAIDGTVAILEELAAAGIPLYGLTNWSAETFPRARPRFPFFERFRAIVVSGELRVIKPDPAIFEHLLRLSGTRPAETVFIDDSAKNVAGAAALGFIALRFETPEALRRDLAGLGLLS
jgi:2-haloacid dehalogenase